MTSSKHVAMQMS